MRRQQSHSVCPALFGQTVLSCSSGFKRINCFIDLAFVQQRFPESECDVRIFGILLMSALQPRKTRSALLLFGYPDLEKDVARSLTIV